MREVESNSEALDQLQRRYFLTLEKYLDRGIGFCPFRNEACCRAVMDALDGLSDLGWHWRHYVIMPNHLHVLLDTEPDAAAMKEIWGPWKGRTARACNRILGRRGAFWHKDWFDRWMRNATGTERAVAYIRNNPVKAGLVRDWKEFRWVR